MATQLNKTPASAVSNKRDALEAELTGKMEERKDQMDAGRFKHEKGDKLAQAARSKYKEFSIKQGRRRRHPSVVLAQFAEIAKQTSNAGSAWERALMAEHQRTTIPKDYKVKDTDMIASQIGIVQAAQDNYSKSRSKFDQLSVVPGA